MRNILFLFAITTLAVLASCQRATYLKTDVDTLQATISGKTGEVRIETDVKDVEITHSPQWMKTSLNEDNTIMKYEFQMNTDRNLREDSIVLSCAGLTRRILVRQSFKATYVKLNPAVVKLPRSGGTAEVEVDADSETGIVVDHSNIARVEGRKVIIRLTESGASQEKTIVKVSCDDVSADLIVEQESNKCPTCGGEGFLNRACSQCNGLGVGGCCNYTGKEKCPKCDGFGIIAGH